MRDSSRFPIGCVSFVEPGLGADTGLPDTFVLINGLFVPLELKRGQSVVKELRPSQRLWHRTSIMRGARTYGAAIGSDNLVRLYEMIGSSGSLSGPLSEKLLSSVFVGLFTHQSLITGLKL